MLPFFRDTLYILFISLIRLMFGSKLISNTISTCQKYRKRAEYVYLIIVQYSYAIYYTLILSDVHSQE